MNEAKLNFKSQIFVLHTRIRNVYNIIKPHSFLPIFIPSHTHTHIYII